MFDIHFLVPYMKLHFFRQNLQDLQDFFELSCDILSIQLSCQQTKLAFPSISFSIRLAVLAVSDWDPVGRASAWHGEASAKTAAR